MKYLKILLLGLLPFSSYAQSPLLPVTVPIVNVTTPMKDEAWLYLPKDYYTSTKQYPVVIFYPGTGVVNRNGLMSQALLRLIADGMRPDNIRNPIDGQDYSFIVLSCARANSFSVPSQVRWLKENYRIDENRIYLTGLSAGATIAMQSAALKDSISRQITAVVGMSTPPTLNALTPSLVNNYKIKSLQYSGNSDSYTKGAETFEETYNNAFPNSSKLTIFDGGHCCWETFYDVNYKDPNSGLSIWQWMLTNTKAVNKTLPVKFKSIKLTKKQ